MSDKDTNSTPEQPSLIERGRRSYQEWHASLIDTPEKQALYQQGVDEFDEWLKEEEGKLARPRRFEGVAAITKRPYTVVKSARSGRFVSNSKISRSQPSTTYSVKDSHSKKSKKK